MIQPASSMSCAHGAENVPASCCQHASPAASSALRASLPDDHPVATMLDEHQTILARLERLAGLCAAPGAPARAELEELGQLAEHLIGAEPHHQREEQVLFPALQERGVHGPPEVMISEHVRLRELKHALQGLARQVLAGERGRWTELQATAEALVEMLGEHIAKEDGILYPLALRVIEPGVWAELRVRCDAIGYCCPRAGASLTDARA